MKVAIGWQLSSYFGWGVYGINLALELAKRDVEAMTTGPVVMNQIVLDKLRMERLRPVMRASAIHHGAPPPDYTLLQALGNDFLPESRARIGVTFFEEALSPAAVERAKRYDIIITGSTWNEEVLRSHQLTNVRTLIQGVDRSLFYPAPRRNMFPGRFLIFSGGKAEPRKGQDIVVRAFRIFARKHPEAMLVTAWHSPWSNLARGMDLDLSEFADRVIDVGAVPNGQMATVYRECHVGLFPNRSEGGTNLVAMEAIACGVPCIISGCTGHLDLWDMAGRNTMVTGMRDGEPILDSVLECLEHAFKHYPLPSEPHKLPEWSETADGLLAAVREVSSQ